MLVASETEKKETSILKRISDSDSIASDNILKFYGTYVDSPSKYLVMNDRAKHLKQSISAG